jgi:hypothetical protein
MGFRTRDVAERVSGGMIFFWYWRGRSASRKDLLYELRASEGVGGAGNGFEVYRWVSDVNSGASLTGCFSSARGDRWPLSRCEGSVMAAVLAGAVSWSGKGRLRLVPVPRMLPAVGGRLDDYAGTSAAANSQALAFACTTAVSASCHANLNSG